MLAERARQLPQGWSISRIAEFATECKQRAGYGDDLPVLSVTKHRGIVRSDQFFKKRVHGKDTSNYKVVHPGQFAYATIHLNEGSIGRLRDSTSGIVSPMYTVFGVHDDIDPDYLFAVLKSTRSLDVYAKITQGTVNRRGGISFRTLSALLLHHPPLPEQRKIAAILSSVDDAIEKTQAVIDQVQVVKRGLMQELFTRGLPGRHKRFKQTEIGKIPKEWRLLRLSEVADIRRGASPRPIRDQKWFSDDGPGWVRIADVTRADRFLRSTDQILSELGKSKSVPVGPGDLIMSICGTIGKPVILGIHACIHDGFVVFKNIQTQVRRDFLYYQLQAAERHFVGRGQPGTQKNLNTTIVGRTLIPLPSADEQDGIAQILWAIDDSIATNKRLLEEQLRRTKECLTSVLLTGEIRVTSDPEAA